MKKSSQADLMSMCHNFYDTMLLRDRKYNLKNIVSVLTL